MKTKKSWYKEAQDAPESSSSSDYKLSLRKLHPDLKRNSYFLFGIDPVKYEHVQKKFDKLTGQAYRNAKRLIDHGKHWRKMLEDPEYAARYQLESQQELDKRELALKKRPDSPDKGEKKSMPLDRYINHDKKTGWWDQDVLETPPKSYFKQ